MSISLTAIRYFVTAAKYENFSKAANELYTAQPNLSKRIADLERTIGVRLFQRTGKQVRLTEAGRLLNKEWTDVLNRFDQSLSRAQALQQERDNVLSLGILEGVHISSLVPQRLKEFQSAHPDVTVRLERCGMHQLWQGFDAGRLDMIVTSEVSGMNPPYPLVCGQACHRHRPRHDRHQRTGPHGPAFRRDAVHAPGGELHRPLP